MKNVVLATAAILALAIVPAALAATEPTTTATEPTVTTIPRGDNAVTEKRTNPVSAMHSSDPGLNATGTVVSSNDQEVVISTSVGPTHIKLLPTTLGMRTFNVGQSISVDFSRNEQGVLLAKKIMAAEVTAPAPEVMVSTEPIAAPVAAEPKQDLDKAAVSVKASVEPPVATPAALPATASNSPLLALLGLMALGGAVALRRQ